MDREEIRVKGHEAVDKIKELVQRGNVTKIVVKNSDGNILLNIPMTFMVVGVVFAPFLAGMAAVLGAVKHCKISVESD